MSVRIIIDSACDLPKGLAEHFTIVPLTVRFGDREYRDGVDLGREEFYEKLVESDTLPTTSQINPAAFAAVFAEVAAAGDTAVVLTLSAELSGTYQSAVIAAEDYPGTIHVVDSRSVAVGMGILAQYALILRDRSLSAFELALELNRMKEKVTVVALFDTLEYLRRGGRISKTAAIAGSMLSIKPVMAIRDGSIVALGKARGSRQGNNLLVKEIEAVGGVDFDLPLLLGYSGLSDVLMRKYIEDSAHLWQDYADELPTAIIGSAVGTHAGPGAVAVAFFRKG